MTRKQIETDYNVDEHGIIRSPGKFEAEMLYAPYFYDAMLNGESDPVNGVDYFELTAEDKVEFPELINVYGVALEESEQGFVYVTTLDTKEEFDKDVEMQSRLQVSECE